MYDNLLRRFHDVVTGGHLETLVCKTLDFNAAHFLPNHDSPCSNVHGHTFTVEMFAVGEPDHDGPERGMVVDFGKLKEVFIRRVHRRLDHTLLNESIAIVHPPTTENVAAWILGELHRDIPEVRGVRLWEGPRQYAEVWVDS